MPPGCIIEHRATACPECAPAAWGTTGTVFPSCTAGSSACSRPPTDPAPLQLVEPEENQILSGRLTLELSVTAPRERRPHHDSGEGFRRASWCHTSMHTPRVVCDNHFHRPQEVRMDVRSCVNRLKPPATAN